MVIKKSNKSVNINCGPNVDCGSSGCSYFLGFLGAAVYYVQAATGFWGGVVGFLKALVWPAFLVYDLLVFIGL